MEANRVKRVVRGCGLLLGSFVCLIAFSMPAAAQGGGDPAKAQMQEMNRREMQLNSLGEDKGGEWQ